MTIQPMEGVVVVELIGKYGGIPTPDKPHDTYTSGRVIKMNKLDTDKHYLLDTIAYWPGYKDDARVGNNQCFILIKDILGYEVSPSTD